MMMNAAGAARTEIFPGKVCGNKQKWQKNYLECNKTGRPQSATTVVGKNTGVVAGHYDAKCVFLKNSFGLGHVGLKLEIV